VNETTMSTRGAIAIIGAGYRLPGAEGPEELWRILEEGRDCVREVPPERWDAQADFDPDPAAAGKSNSRWGGFLDGLTGFDAALFRMSSVEAASTDPQHRLLLEATWRALEDAGLDPSKPQAQETAVFTAVGANEHLARAFPDPSRFNSYSTVGNIASLAANRVSYFFDFQGPSVAVDTGCSSTLVALDLACERLRSSDVQRAVVAAANTLLSRETQIAVSRAWALSSSGRCRFLDESADGYVRSEGAGALVLARLEDALARGERVLGIIRATAVNHHGTGTSLTSPTRHAITQVMRKALTRAGVSADAVGYVEAHGIGSPSTDRTEIEAVGEVLGRASGALPVGSIKGNLGHLESASGIAAIAKVLLAFEHGHIPRQLHLQNVRKDVDPDALGVTVPRSPLPWPRAAAPRVALINSFGLGGTNACVVLEEPPARTAAHAPPPHGLVLSARTEGALRTLASRWADAIARAPDALPSLCANARRGRGGLPLRLTLVAEDAGTLVERLRAFAAGGARPEDALPPLSEAARMEVGIHAPGYPFERRELRALTPPVAAPAPVPATPREPERPTPAPAAPRPRAREVRGLIEGALRELLGLGASEPVPAKAGFVQLGLTSLGMVELKSRLSRELGLSLPATLAFDQPTVESLTAYLVERLGMREEAPSAASAELDAVVQQLEGLSDEDLRRLLEATGGEG
jgi:acyl transferase domain-containing protein/acyl carrier protein